ncbi:MAG TPA: UvrD-helicase domain-containing protein [Gaiellales bacterium]
MSTTTDATDQLLAGLNPAQREAVTLPDGPALVIAGAGSGKTRVLTARIGYLLGEGRARPHEILAITFTNRAAAEMKERVETLVGQSRGMWVMTFHAACGRILRREADRLGYRSNFTIYDQADQVRVVKACLEELGRDPKRFPPRGIHSRISSEKNRLVSAAMFRENIGNFFDQVVADVFELYERRMHASNAMDFDDMMVRTVELLEGFDDVRERWQGSFSQLLVDEYQDTNHAQYRIVRLLSDAHRNVMVVGDADQAIYTWRGADIRNILDFERDYPDARVVRLEQNYRSTQRILDAANAVIENNAGRIEKRLWSEIGSGEPVRVIEAEDEHDEARIVAARIGALIEGGSSASEIAVFYRTNAQSRVLEDLLVRHGVPYQVIGGPRFYERAEVKDAMAYLSVLDNATDEIALRRIINQPRRGIGDASVDRLAATAGFSGGSLWDALTDPEGAGLGAAAARSVRAFRGLMDELRDKAVELPVGELLETLLSRTGVIEGLEAERTIEATGRIENLQELVGVAREYTARTEEPSLAGFLQEVALTADADALAAESGAGRVTLMTLHNAKGLEFNAVFVIGMEQNLFPHVRAIEEANIEEERRLCYVAITRARRELSLVYARQRTLFGARGNNLPSQFIDEIPQSLVEHERKPRSMYGSASRSGGGAGGSRTWESSSGGYTPSGAGAITQMPGIAPRDEVPSLSVGDNVTHDQLGEGVVTGTADGGQVIVRFRSDGSERRLLLAYAPLKRI